MSIELRMEMLTKAIEAVTAALVNGKPLSAPVTGVVIPPPVAVLPAAPQTVPAPVVPQPVQTVPQPVAPAPVAPQPVAPAPVAPAPVQSVPGLTLDAMRAKLLPIVQDPTRGPAVIEQALAQFGVQTLSALNAANYPALLQMVGVA